MAAMSQAAPTKSGLFWALAGLCGFFVLINILFIVMFFMSGDHELGQSIESGQRLQYAPKTGDFTGNMRRSESEPTDTNLPPTLEDEPQDQSNNGGVKKNITFDVGPEPGTANQNNGSTGNIKSSLVGSEEEVAYTIRAYPVTNASLREAPGRGMVEKSPQGSLPKKGKDGESREYYARPFDMPKPKKPLISVLVLGIGTNRESSEQAFKLPMDITLAVNPYAESASVWTESSRNLGHETWLMLPAQPVDFPASDPGPMAVLNDLSLEDNLLRLNQTMATALGYAGLVVPPNTVLGNKKSTFTNLANNMSKRGLAVLSVEAPGEIDNTKLLRESDFGLIADAIADKVLRESAIKSRLKSIEDIARKNGRALVVINAYPLSIRLIDEWTKELQNKGFVLAPATALLQLKE